MASLPSDRTKLALAQSNQNPGIAAGSVQNKNALTEAYDTIDLLNQKVDSNVGASTLVPYPPSNLFRNGFINAGMEIAQRGASSTIATGTSAYTVDRIKSINNGSGVNATASQVNVADLDGASFGLQLIHAALPSVGGQLMDIYTMEAKDAYKYAGKTVVFQIKVKAAAGMDRATLKVRYKTTEAAVTDADTLVLAGSPIPILSNTWTTISITVTLPIRSILTTTGVIGFQIVGSKTTAEASGDGFTVTEWGLNEGSSVLPFQPRSFADELSLCQRFYEKSYPYATIPGSSTISSGIQHFNVPSNTIANFQNYGTIYLKVKKRVTPTITIYPYSVGTNTGMVSATNGTDLAAGSGVPFHPNENTFTVRNEAGVITTGGIEVMFHFSCDAEL